MPDMPPKSSPAGDFTAQTLHHVLGNLGGRQKSWMHETLQAPPSAPAQPPISSLPIVVKRRGRPPKPPAPSTNAQTRAPFQSATERQPPSASTSPQLANIVTRNVNANGAAPPATVLPSPTPSEETAQSAPTLHSGQMCPDIGYSGGRHTGLPFSAPSELAVTASARGKQKRHSESAMGSTSKRGRLQDAGEAQPAASTRSSELPPPQLILLSQSADHHRSTSHLQRDSSGFSLQPSSSLFGLNRAGSRVQPPQHQQGNHVQHVSIPPSQTQARLGPPRPLAVDSIRDAPSATTDSAHHPVLQISNGTSQQFMPQGEWYTSEECLQVLHSFTNSCPSIPPQSPDAKRLSVLKDATHRKDWSYLIMHQFYCLFDFSPESLPSEIRNGPGVVQAHRVLQGILQSNESLSPPARAFFGQYPYPLRQISAIWPDGLHYHTRSFLSFVTCCRQYELLKVACDSRLCPPFAWELALSLGIDSLTLRLLVFTSILRNVWRNIPQGPVKGSFERKAIEFFHQNQDDFLRRVALTQTRQNLDFEGQQRDNERESNYWGSCYHQLYQEMIYTLHNQGFIEHRPNVPSPVQQQEHPLRQHHLRSPELHSSIGAMTQQDHPPAQRHSTQARTHPQAQSHPPHATAQRTRVPQRPQTHPVPLANTAQPQQVSRPLVPNSGRLLPEPGFIQPQQRIPNPARFGLHQAHLRSPILKTRSFQSPLYQVVQSYVKRPTPLSTASREVERWTFNVSSELFNSIAKTVKGVPHLPDERIIDIGSETVRLRCIKWSGDMTPNEHTWAVTDTSWIPYSYFTLNDVSLQQRRKLHHGKDLPIDLTELLKEGENVLEATVMAQTDDTSYQKYLLAIEVVGVMPHESILGRCLSQQRLSAEHVMRDIKRKISGSTEDDEVAIVESHLTINLFDPFSASKMCDIPVRSRACLHIDCFDLETFLQTRRRIGDVSVVDQWRCPICKADARPQHLFVDGFMEQVKKDLEARGLAETRAIIVLQDGSWKPKAEVRDPNGVSDDSPTLVPTQPRSLDNIEIIDISD